jgi:D-tyrosyl-tRNA(Tyr) deacylase
MIALIQRVSRADVQVESETVGAIGRGILALIGVRRGDDTVAADRLLERLLTYRIFSDEQGKMNLSLRDTQGELLLVPQFTLAADTHKGTRAGFSTRPRRMRHAGCSTISSFGHGLYTALWRRVYSVLICRCR